MKNIRRTAILLLLSTAILTASPQDQGCTVKRSFRVKEGTWLNVNNKYGDVTFITTPGDSMTICATVTIQQDNRVLADKSISLINMEIEKKADTVSVNTRFDDKFFSSQYRNGRRSFSVDYIINLPLSANLNVNNSFGDINIDETEGLVNVSLSHGDLNGSKFTRGNVKPVSQIDLENSKVRLGEVNWMVINAKHCQSVTITNARALVLTTEYSKLGIEEAGSVVCKSVSDIYQIKSVKNIAIQSTYSAFEINTLLNSLQAITTYGSMQIKELRNDFSLFDLTAGHTPVNITTQKGISYKCNISLVNTPLDSDLDSYPAIKRSSTGNVTTISGVAGKNMNTKSELKIKLSQGLLNLK